MKALTHMLYEQQEAPLLKPKKKRMIFPLAFPRDQHMGYVCEIAVLCAIKNVPLVLSISTRPLKPEELSVNAKKILAFFNSSTVFPKRNSAVQLVLTRLNGSTTSDEYIQNTYTFFVNAMNSVKNSLNNSFGTKTVREIVGSDVLELPPSATAKYDVVTAKANLHVKLNQSGTGSRVVASTVEVSRAESVKTPRMISGGRKTPAKSKPNKQKEATPPKNIERRSVSESMASTIMQQGPKKVSSYGAKFEEWQRKSLGNPNFSGGKLLHTYLIDKLSRTDAMTGLSPESISKLASALFEEWISTATGRLKGRDKASDYNKKNKPFIYETETPEKTIHFEIQNPLAWFTAFKGKYKQLWVIGFKEAIKPSGFLYSVQEELVYDIAIKVSGEASEPEEGSAKEILWFYFQRSNDGDLSPTLQVKRFKFKDVATNGKPINLFVGYQYLNKKALEDPVGMGGRAAVPKTVVYVSYQENPPESEMTNPANQLFTIELRTDGNNHPPQFKVGRGLATARPNDGSLIGEIISVAEPPKTPVSP